MNLILMSGAGNTFAMIDGFAHDLPRDLPGLARAACREIETKLDGLLIATKPVFGGDCAMVVYNADGSRPETCGNGLRCVAKLVADRGYVEHSAFVIETDAGPRPTTVERENGRVVRARVHMGKPIVVARDIAIAIEARDGQHVVRGTLVDVGNPHCVLFVDDERTAPVATHGPLVERHSLFPRGTNVEFLALRSGQFQLRVWERGVGETQACGSGACAAAVAAVERGFARFPVKLNLPGGRLDVDDDGKGGVFLSGPVEELASIEWSPGQRAQRSS